MKSILNTVLFLLSVLSLNAQTGNQHPSSYIFKSIAISGSTLSILGSVPNAPVAALAANITTNSFAATWNSVTGATSYQLDVTTDNFTTYVSGYLSKEVTITTQTITGLTPGTIYRYRVRAVNARGASVNSNTIVAITLKENQFITFQSLLDKTLGDSPFELSGSTTSNLEIAYTTSSDKITINQNQVTVIKAGRVTITASQSGNDSYNAAESVSLSFCIKPAKPSITVSSATFTTTILTSNVTSGNQWYVDDVLISGATNTFLTVANRGVYKVQITEDGCASEFSSNFLLSAVGTPPSWPSVNEATNINATAFVASWAASEGATGYQIDVSTDNFASFITGYNSKVISVATETVSGLLPATKYGYRVRAINEAGSSNNSKTIFVTTSKQNQLINFQELGDKTVGDLPFTLTATASSNLGITYSTTSDKISLNGGEVTVVNAGRASIMASQVGSDTYNAAEPIIQSFCVKPVKPMIMGSSPSSVTETTLTSTAATGNQWYLNGEPINGAINNALSVKKSGVYKVNVRVDGCISSFSTDFQVILMGVKPTAPIASIATQVSPHSFKASWSVSLGATGYQLDVTNNNFTTFINGYNSKELTENSVIVSELNSGIKYQYRVRAINTAGISENSNTVAVETIIITGEDNGYTLSVSPNPIEDVFRINGIKGEILQIQMIDMKGCIMPAFFERDNGFYTVSAKQLLPGIYLLRIFQRDALIQLKLEKK